MEWIVVGAALMMAGITLACCTAVHRATVEAARLPLYIMKGVEDARRAKRRAAE